MYRDNNESDLKCCSSSQNMSICTGFIGGFEFCKVVSENLKGHLFRFFQNLVSVGIPKITFV